MNKPINSSVRLASSQHVASHTTKNFGGKLFLRRKKQRKNSRQAKSEFDRIGRYWERQWGGGEVKRNIWREIFSKGCQGGVSQGLIIVQLCPVWHWLTCPHTVTMLLPGNYWLVTSRHQSRSFKRFGISKISILVVTKISVVLIGNKFPSHATYKFYNIIKILSWYH